MKKRKSMKNRIIPRLKKAKKSTSCIFRRLSSKKNAMIKTKEGNAPRTGPPVHHSTYLSHSGAFFQSPVQMTWI